MIIKKSPKRVLKIEPLPEIPYERPERRIRADQQAASRRSCYKCNMVTTHTITFPNKGWEKHSCDVCGTAHEYRTG